MTIQRNQQLIDKIRSELNLPLDLVTDDELWQGAKNSFVCHRINFNIAVKALVEIIKNNYHFNQFKKLAIEYSKYQEAINRLRMLRKDLDENTIMAEAQKIATTTPYTTVTIINDFIILAQEGKSMPWEEKE